MFSRLLAAIWANHQNNRSLGRKYGSATVIERLEYAVASLGAELADGGGLHDESFAICGV